MAKNKLFIALGIIILVVTAFALVFVRRVRQNNDIDRTPDVTPVLPINQIPLKDRPFITLTPDDTGRNLDLLADNMIAKEVVEYELVYDAGGIQEGAFGRIDFEVEETPVTKTLLLGSKSAGGAVTYHEGVTGGSLSLIYSEQKLKEDFNFLTTGEDATFGSKDGRFEAIATAKNIKKGKKVVVMKTFGLPSSLDGEVIAGPYGIFAPKTAALGKLDVNITVPSSAGTSPILYMFTAGEWKEVKTTAEGNILSASAVDGNVFVVITQ